MQFLWNAMSDAMFECKDVSFYPEPGAAAVSAVSSPSIKQSYRTMTNNLKTSFDQFNLRDCLLSSCQELNRGEFFIVLQMSLLVFFPGLGLSIIAQTCDVDEADAMQQLDIIENADDQDIMDYTRTRIRTMEQQQQKRIASIRYTTKSTKISTPTNAHGSDDSEEAMRGIGNGEGRRVTTKVWQTVVIHF